MFSLTIQFTMTLIVKCLLFVLFIGPHGQLMPRIMI
jgi:hypothetical protein